jgi:diadenosine tetraphosphate (Ap4A) HIT family hydrolase
VSSDKDSLKEYDQPLIETDNFFVVSAIGQFIKGYLLICSKSHFLNMGSLDTSIFDEFIEVKERVRKLLYDVYEISPIFFEHGAARIKNRAGTCVDHAHLHAVPIEIHDAKVFSSIYFCKEIPATPESVISFSKTGNPYFFLEISDRRMYLFDALLLPCQFGRRVLAQLVHLNNHWNWRKYPFESNAINTTRKLQEWIGSSDGK